MKLQTFRLAEVLTRLVNKVQPKDLADIEEIRTVQGIAKDIEALIPSYIEKFNALRVPQDEILRESQKKYRIESQKLNDEEKKNLAAKMDSEIVVKIEEFIASKKTELDELEAIGATEIDFELSPKKASKLKDIFEKNGKEVFADINLYVAIADGLGI